MIRETVRRVVKDSLFTWKWVVARVRAFAGPVVSKL
jgi:hypothetical protein